MKRLDRTGAAIANALRILPYAGEPGYPAPGELAGDLAFILRGLCGPMELVTLASASVLALDDDTRKELVGAAERDSAPPWPFPGVDREMWRQVCREHRSPALTPIEKRRAAQISFDDDPRSKLAFAWNGASDRDRRDLVARVTKKETA